MASPIANGVVSPPPPIMAGVGVAAGELPFAPVTPLGADGAAAHASAAVRPQHKKRTALNIYRIIVKAAPSGEPGTATLIGTQPTIRKALSVAAVHLGYPEIPFKWAPKGSVEFRLKDAVLHAYYGKKVNNYIPNDDGRIGCITGFDVTTQYFIAYADAPRPDYVIVADPLDAEEQEHEEAAQDAEAEAEPVAMDAAQARNCVLQ